MSVGFGVDEGGGLIIPQKLRDCGKGKGDPLPDGKGNRDVDPCWLPTAVSHGPGPWTAADVAGFEGKLCDGCSSLPEIVAAGNPQIGDALDVAGKIAGPAEKETPS